MPEIAANVGWPHYAIEDGGTPVIIQGKRVDLLPNGTTMDLLQTGNNRVVGKCDLSYRLASQNHLNCLAPAKPIQDVFEYEYNIYYAEYRIKEVNDAGVTTRANLTIKYLPKPTVKTLAEFPFVNEDALKNSYIGIEGMDFCLGLTAEQTNSGSNETLTCVDIIDDWRQYNYYSVIFRDTTEEKKSLRCKIEKITNTYIRMVYS